MTDEELFKQWKSEQYKDQSTEEKMEFVEHLHTFPEYFEQTFLAGLKAKTQWHKPDEPTERINELVLGYIKSYSTKKYCLVGWNGEWWYDANTYNREVKLITWCKLPKFEKE